LARRFGVSRDRIDAARRELSDPFPPRADDVAIYRSGNVKLWSRLDDLLEQRSANASSRRGFCA
jgi:hypothetical protein